MTVDLFSVYSDRCACGHRTSDHDPLGCSVCPGHEDEPCTVDVFSLRRKVIAHAREWGLIGLNTCCDPGDECSYC
jgi:hypothetical protein